MTTQTDIDIKEMEPTDLQIPSNDPNTITEQRPEVVLLKYLDI